MDDLVVGIDEVGRGCLAGPLVAGAVLLPRPIVGLKDSKLLSRYARQKLAPLIKAQALGWGLGWASALEVDSLGLTKATSLAMERALAPITHHYRSVIIDGQLNFLAHLKNTLAIIKADQHVPSVSAASIIAKVARDEYMTKLAELYPNYAFHKNVGYGTALHLQGLALYGACQEHRLSFKPLKLLLESRTT